MMNGSAENYIYMSLTRIPRCSAYIFRYLIVHSYHQMVYTLLRSNCNESIPVFESTVTCHR